MKIQTSSSLHAFILLIGLFLTAGCSSVRENPDDTFAPRPENASSTSYHIVRLDEGRYRNDFDKASLLKKIVQYRNDYRTIKKESDFGTDYYEEHRYKQYLIAVQSFKDSDLDAAERYLKSLPDSITFIAADRDEEQYDIGDINWSDESRTLRVVDFYALSYSDDWSPYAFIINLIPTARNGYGKLSCSIDGETLSFRKALRKKIWTFGSGYYWVYAQILTLKDGKDQAPMLLVIADPNYHGDMNGTYLIMPRNGVTVNTTALEALRKSDDAAYDTVNADSWQVMTKERIAEAKVIKSDLDRGLSPEKIVNTLVKHRGSDQSEDILFQMITLYQHDPKQFEQRLDALNKE